MIDLTIGEKNELRRLLETPDAIGGMRKVWQQEMDYNLEHLKTEALGGKDVGKMVEYAAKADAAEKQELKIKTALKESR